MEEAHKDQWRGFRIAVRVLAQEEHRVSELFMDVSGLIAGLSCRMLDHPCDEYNYLTTILQRPGCARLDLPLNVAEQEHLDWFSLRSGYLAWALSEAKDLHHIYLCTTV